MILHLISDTHIGEIEANEARLKRIIQRIDGLAGHHLVAVLGDLTENGTPSEYATIRPILQNCRHPVLAVPGNHDCGRRGIVWQEANRRYFDMFITRDVMNRGEDEQWPLVHHELVETQNGPERYTFILLDSQAGQEGEIVPALARGELGKEQLARLDYLLGLYPNAILLMHHHPLWHEVFHALEDERKLAAILAKHQPVGIAFGHRHKPFYYGGLPGFGRTIACGKATLPYDDSTLRHWIWDLSTHTVDMMVV